MSKKNRIVIGLALALGLGAGWWGLERATRPSEVDTSRPGRMTPPTDRPEVPVVVAGAVTGSSDPAMSADEAGMTPSSEFVTPETAPAVPLTAGEILAEPDEDYVRVAKKLSALALDPRASMEDRAEALAHALNLSAGNEAEVLTPLVANPALPDELTETILAEALNRPLAYQADLYLAALAVRKTPEMQTLIREHLAFLTGGEDLGADPKAWAEAIKTAKKDWEE